ncbi:MAG: ATP-binding protein [Nitrospira sp.]|nr:ATP-binding protein [Nitrospira sp.]
MLNSEDKLRGLREALRLSPDNLPIRELLANALLEQGLGEDAEREFLQALRLCPDSVPLKVGLARSFLQQNKIPPALAMLEDMAAKPNVPASVMFLYATVLRRTGLIEQAVTAYKTAIAGDPSLADDEFARELGVGADPDLSEVVDGKARAAAGDGQSSAAPDFEKPRIAFADVGGMEHVKEEIRMKIIGPMAHPEMYAAYGKAIGGGILMYGPPGCGKTHLARATAGEVQAHFLAVGISDVLDMWIGQSEKNLHELFQQARDHKPCVLFFDEVDALGAARTDMRQSAGRHLINQFLSELDGVQHSNDGVLVLAATNAPWHLDAAFRRPGRFDRVLFVPPPDQAARESILRILCKQKPVADLDYAKVAGHTEYCSGADLKAVVDVAVEQKLREAMKEGVPKPLSTKDLTAAAKTVKPSTKEWFSTARNYALYANQGGIYDDILRYLKL